MCSSCVWAPAHHDTEAVEGGHAQSAREVAVRAAAVLAVAELEADVGGDGAGALVKSHGRGVRGPQRPHRPALDLDAHVGAHASDPPITRPISSKVAASRDTHSACAVQAIGTQLTISRRG